VGSLRIGRRRVSIPDIYACVPPGGRFVHRLDVDGRRGRTRIVSVRFFFDDGQPSAIDRRAPWRKLFGCPSPRDPSRGQRGGDLPARRLTPTHRDHRPHLGHVLKAR